jgi:alpha-L-fucosidase
MSAILFTLPLSTVVSTSGSFADQKIAFNAKDIRFTLKGDLLYAITLGLPKENTVIKILSLKSGNGIVGGIEIVGSNEKVSWQQEKTGLVIKPFKTYPSVNAVTYPIRFK